MGTETQKNTTQTVKNERREAFRVTQNAQKCNANSHVVLLRHSDWLHVCDVTGTYMSEYVDCRVRLLL